jgi:tRNA acetyltransferase TAN1
MITNPNFIVTTLKGREAEGCREIRSLLMEFGDGSAKAEITDVTGVILGRTELNSSVVIDGLRRIVATEPWRIQLVQRYIPLMISAKTSLPNIVAAVKEIRGEMKDSDSFRITVERRHSNIESSEIISQVAELFKNRVDLEHPDKVVVIEVVGDITGVSILKPSSIFSSSQEKRGSI